MDVDLPASVGTGKYAWRSGMFELYPYGIRVDRVAGVLRLGVVKVKSPAYLANLKKGDVVLAWGDTCPDPSDYSACMAYLRECEAANAAAVLRIDRPTKGTKGGRPKAQSQTPEQRREVKADSTKSHRVANPEAHREARRIHDQEYREGLGPEQRDRNLAVMRRQRKAAYEKEKEAPKSPPPTPVEKLKAQLAERAAEREKAVGEKVAELTEKRSYAAAVGSGYRTPPSSIPSTPTRSPRHKSARREHSYAWPGSSYPSRSITASWTLTDRVAVPEVEMEVAGRVRETLDFHYETSHEMLFGTQFRPGEAIPQYHYNLLTLGRYLDSEVMMVATQKLKEAVEARAAAGVGLAAPEILNPVNMAMVADDTVLPKIVDPEGEEMPELSLSIVFIGSFARGDMGGHYVLLASHRDQLNEVHVFDSLSNFTLDHPRSELFLTHLGKVGATLKRQSSTSGLTLLFHKIPQQQGHNSCGAYALMNLAAMVQGVDPASLHVEDELLLRRRVHDQAFCQPTAQSELTPMLLCLEDNSNREIVEGESNMATKCQICDQFPEHYEPTGIPRVRQRTVEIFHGPMSPFPKVREPEERELVVEEDLESTIPYSDVSESSGGEEVQEPVKEISQPVTSQRRSGRLAQKAPQSYSSKKTKGCKAPSKVQKRRRVDLGSADLVPLKRRGVAKHLRSCCGFCGAWLWKDEAGQADQVTRKWCCGKGSLVSPKLTPYSATFYEEGVRIDPKFLKSTRVLNNMFQLASSGVTGKWRNDFAFGTSYVKIEGRMYHKVWNLSYPGKRAPRISQLCIMDPDMRDKEATAKKVDPALANDVQTFLETNGRLFNEYQELIHLDHDEAFLTFQKASRDTHGPVLGDVPETPKDHMPRLDEVYGVVEMYDDGEPREVVIRKRGADASTTIKTHNPIYEPLSYPVMRPHGDASWEPNFKSTKGNKMSHLEYQKQQFLTEPRTWELGRLGQELAVDAASRLEEERLRWVRCNQTQLRIGTREEIAARLGDSDGPMAGRSIVLPATFTGGPRYMKQKYHEGMATILQKGNPDLFVTMTCNPAWPEIKGKVGEDDSEESSEEEEEDNPDLSSITLNVGVSRRKPRLKRKSQTGKKLLEKKWGLKKGSQWSGRPRDCPAMVVRVFKLKLAKLMADLKGGKLFGSRSDYHLQVIEFQKRGLPHAHILVRFKTPLTVDDIAEHISTEVPGEEDAELRELVLRHHVHGPCGRANPSSPCMVKGRCSKGFPKGFNDYSHIDQRGFPIYRRAQTPTAQVTKGKKTHLIDSRWIVPYNPHLLRKFKCHLNVEYSSCARTVRYLYKYLSKGPDQALAATTEEGQVVDEVKDYESRRVMGAAEALWRIFGFPMHDRFPSVKSIVVHLPPDAKVSYKESDPAAALERTTELERYFNRPEDPIFDELTVLQYYSHFHEVAQPTTDSNGLLTSWPHPDGRHHIKDRVQGEMICRMHWLGSGRSEEHYLRLILGKFSARSFEELRTVKGEQYATFQLAAQALGMVKEDQEFQEMMREAMKVLTASQLRSMLASLIVGESEFPAGLIWAETDIRAKLTDDFHLIGKLSQEEAENSALLHISRLLHLHNRTLGRAGLPECRDPTTEASREEGRWAKDEQRAFVDKWAPQLSAEQRHVVDTLLRELTNYQSYQIHWPPLPDLGDDQLDFRPIPAPTRSFYLGTRPRYFALLAPGGTGKTLALNVFTSWLRSHGHTVICTASTGIASLNFPGGMTAHSMFGIPLECVDSSATSPMSMRSQRAEFLRQATAIIVDEAYMLQRYAFQLIDRLLKELKSPKLRMVILVGDLKQICPVIKGGSKNDILRASVRFDPMWDKFTKLTLTRNLRARGDPEYCRMAATIGDGSAATVQLQGSRLPLTPLPLIRTVDSRRELIRFVYPNLADPYDCIRSAILAGTNAQIDEWNREMLAMLPGPLEEFYSCDFVEDEGSEKISSISPDLLAGLNEVGVPPSTLQLKVNSCVMLVRNTNFAERLCNSTRVIVREILPSRRTIMVELPGEDGSEGRRVPVHRICFSFESQGKGMTIKRRQFPLRPCYCVTHNKAQGATLRRCGLDLTEDVFSHGALYVDVTRVCNRRDIRVLTRPERILNAVPHTLNIVFRELLSDTVDVERLAQEAVTVDDGVGVVEEEDDDAEPAPKDDPRPS